MAKKNNPGERKEVILEKKPARDTKTSPGFETGGAFVEECTGSATMINVDGRWDFDHPAGRRDRKESEF